jgi:hypothetical protein
MAFTLSPRRAGPSAASRPTMIMNSEIAGRVENASQGCHFMCGADFGSAPLDIRVKFSQRSLGCQVKQGDLTEARGFVDVARLYS